jgi:hypothetical protein
MTAAKIAITLPPEQLKRVRLSFPRGQDQRSIDHVGRALQAAEFPRSTRERSVGDIVLTSDPEDIRKLDATLTIERV